jgi:hypothetical protein
MPSDIHESFAAAAASPSRPLDLDRVVRRGRGGRVVQAVVVAGAAALLAAAGMFYTSRAGFSGGDNKNETASGCEIREAFENADVAIYLKQSATRGNRNSIERYLARRTDVRYFTYVSRREAYRRFEEAYPEMASDLGERALPASFKVEVGARGSIDTLVEEVRHFEGVDAVASPPRRPETGDDECE